MLRSEFRLRIPAGIKQYKQRLDMMPGRNLQKLIDALFETLIFLPEQIMQEDTHRVHPQTLSPTQFLIDLGGIESLSLPHFEFVDCICGNVVAADQPRL